MVEFSPVRLGNVAEHAETQNGCGCKGINWDCIARRTVRGVGHGQIPWADQKARLCLGAPGYCSH